MIQTADKEWDAGLQRYVSRTTALVLDKAVNVQDNRATAEMELCDRCKAILAARKKRQREKRERR